MTHGSVGWGFSSYLCVPGVSGRSLWSEGSRCTPCCPRSLTRSTARQRSKVKGGVPEWVSTGGGGTTRTDLPSCDGEVGEDAVLLVLVARVRLQTLAERQQTLIRAPRTDRQTDGRTGRRYLSFAVVPEL